MVRGVRGMTSTGRKSAASVTVFSFVGNPGCIRLPESVRKVSGIKRDDQLLVSVTDTQEVVFEKSGGARAAASSGARRAQVERCTCADPPASCSKLETLIVTV